jgi:hypothetical protein
MSIKVEDYRLQKGKTFPFSAANLHTGGVP